MMIQMKKHKKILNNISQSETIITSLNFSDIDKNDDNYGSESGNYYNVNGNLKKNVTENTNEDENENKHKNKNNENTNEDENKNKNENENKNKK